MRRRKRGGRERERGWDSMRHDEMRCERERAQTGIRGGTESVRE